MVNLLLVQLFVSENSLYWTDSTQFESALLMPHCLFSATSAVRVHSSRPFRPNWASVCGVCATKLLNQKRQHHLDADTANDHKWQKQATGVMR